MHDPPTKTTQNDAINNMLIIRSPHSEDHKPLNSMKKTLNTKTYKKTIKTYKTKSLTSSMMNTFKVKIKM